MLRILSLLSLIAMLLLSKCAAVAAEPIRIGEGWAIHPQTIPEDWQQLVAGGNLISGKIVSPQPQPNDHNTGSELKHLTDGGLAGAEGRMWSDKRAMGWAYQPYARLTFDLEQSHPVGQVVIRLQVINQTSTLPGKITVSLSDDGEDFSPVRVLSVKTKPDDDPRTTYEALPFDPPGIYAVVLDVGYQARFVQLDFALIGAMVTDEMAIVPATGVVKKIPPPPTVTTEYRDYVFDRRDQFRKQTAAGNLLLGKRLHYSPTPTQYLTIDDDDPLKTKTSDGYGTGLVMVIARELGVPADDARLQRGVKWIHANQRESGKWFTESPVNDAGNLISNVGSAYVILALQACGELPGWPFSAEKLPSR